MTNVVREPVISTVVVDGLERLVVTTEQTRVISVGTQGPPGPTGPTGPQGLSGHVARVSTLPWAGAITIDWANADVVRIVLQGPTSLQFTGAVDGQKMMLELSQDNVGNRPALLPMSVRYSATIPQIALSTNANKLDRLGFIFHAATGTYELIAVAIGF